MGKENKIIIIGAGIAGMYTAYFLNRAGYEVTILDKGSGTDNCSYGNAGMIVPSHIIPLASPGIIQKGLRWMLDAESPFYIKPRFNKELLQWGWKFKKASTDKHVKESGPVLRDLLMASRELLSDLEKEEGLEFGYVKKGLFMFCNTEKGMQSEIDIAEKAQALGIPADILTPKKVKEMEPDLEMDIIGATYYPKDAHLHPGSLMDGMSRVLKKRGVTFELNTEIIKFNMENGLITSVLSKDGQVWKGSTFIICSGAWTPSLTRSIGKRLPMQAGKGYSITIENPKKQPQNCGIFAEVKVTMTPMFNMLRFGGTMEINGPDRSINPRKINGLKKSVCSFLPGVKMNDLEGHDIWVGLRPCSPDGLPYVGVFDGIDNLYTSTGHAMMGMSLAPSCAKIIADLITKGSSDLDHPLIDPNRYN